MSDAKASAGAPRRRVSSAESDHRKGVRRKVAFLLLGALFVAGTVAALFAERGYVDLRRSRHELDTMRERLHRQVEKVRVLRGQVRALRTEPASIERIAREELGLVRSGEIVILLPREDPPPGGETGDETDHPGEVD